MRREVIETARLEVWAVISTSRVSSGFLARFAAGEAIEIVPADHSGLIVTFEAAGQRLVSAQVRNEGGKLVATITKLESDRDEWKLDEWRMVSVEPV